MKTIAWFLVCLCAFTVLQTMVVSGLISAVLTTLERRYGLASRQTGLIVSMNDIFSVVFVLFLTHFGQAGHRPRFLFYSALFFGCGAVLFSLPFFLSGQYDPDQFLAVAASCANPLDSIAGNCGGGLSGSAVTLYFVLFLLANGLMGAAISPVYSLGAAYLSDNCGERTSAVYQGYFFAAAAVGPAFGFILGGALLAVWVDGASHTPPDATPEAEEWVGMWWLGFLLCGLLTVLMSFAFRAFPNAIEPPFPRHNTHTSAAAAAAAAAVAAAHAATVDGGGGGGGGGVGSASQKSSRRGKGSIPGATEMIRKKSVNVTGRQAEEEENDVPLTMFRATRTDDSSDVVVDIVISTANPADLPTGDVEGAAAAAAGASAAVEGVGETVAVSQPNIDNSDNNNNDNAASDSDNNNNNNYNPPPSPSPSTMTSEGNGAAGSSLSHSRGGGQPTDDETEGSMRSELPAMSIVTAHTPEITLWMHGRKMWDALWFLVTHQGFMLQCLGSSFDAYIIAAFGAFLPKYVETQFGLPASTAALAVGLVIIPGAAGGLFFGGWLMKRRKIHGAANGYHTALWTSVSTVFVWIFFLQCHPSDYVGITTAYPFAAGPSLSPTGLPRCLQSDRCNATCNYELYQPVCGSNGAIYFNGCLAGCASTSVASSSSSSPSFSETVYHNCSCVEDYYQEQAEHTQQQRQQRRAGSDSNTATFGACASGSCGPTLAIFLLVLGLLMFFSLMNAVPQIEVLMQCLPRQSKSFSLGVQSLVSRLLGAIPGPLILGSVMDERCLYWTTECGRRGSCLVYHPKAIRMAFFGTLLVAKLCASACYWQSYRAFGAIERRGSFGHL